MGYMVWYLVKHRDIFTLPLPMIVKRWNLCNEIVF